MSSSRVKEIIPAPEETPPEKESPVHHDPPQGFNLIKAVYNFFVPQKLVALTVVRKYNKFLKTRTALGQLIYFILLIVCITVDLLQALVVIIVMSILIVAISISFIKGLGLIELPIFKCLLYLTC